MPECYHLSVDQAVETAKEAYSLGITAVEVFGLPEYKDEQGSSAWAMSSPVQQAIMAIKKALPALTVVSDVCLCQYTSHGHCGLIKDNYVTNDETLPLLAKVAVSQAEAGADIVAPSDMMDGRVLAIRQALDDKGYDSQALIADFINEQGALDRRQAGFDLINYLELKTGEDTPKVILFLAPPFCPHNFIDEDSRVNQVLDTVLADFSDTETFKKRRFFPYLSDSSYLAMRETADEIKDMLTDFPMSDTIYPVPFDTIRSLAIPAIDLGVYGKGAHTWKERLYKPYSYGVLPELIRSFTKRMLEGEKQA